MVRVTPYVMLSEFPGKLLIEPLIWVSKGNGRLPPSLNSGRHGSSCSKKRFPQTGLPSEPVKFGSTTSHMFCDRPPNDTPPNTRLPCVMLPCADKSIPSQ